MSGEDPWTRMRTPVLETFVARRMSINHALANSSQAYLLEHFGLLYDQMHLFAKDSSVQQFHSFARAFLATSLANGLEAETIIQSTVTLGEIICEQLRSFAGDNSGALNILDQARVAYACLRILVDVLAEQLAHLSQGQANA